MDELIPPKEIWFEKANSFSPRALTSIFMLAKHHRKRTIRIQMNSGRIPQWIWFVSQANYQSLFTVEMFMNF